MNKKTAFLEDHFLISACKLIADKRELTEDAALLISELVERFEKTIVVHNPEITNEIEARAWCSDFKRMIYKDDLQYAIDIQESLVVNLQSRIHSAVIMMFTGVTGYLNDKIFDKDYITIKSRDRKPTELNFSNCMVSMVNGAWGFTTSETQQFIPFCNFDFERFFLFKVGNKYEG